MNILIGVLLLGLVRTLHSCEQCSSCCTGCPTESCTTNCPTRCCPQPPPHCPDTTTPNPVTQITPTVPIVPSQQPTTISQSSSSDVVNITNSLTNVNDVKVPVVVTSTNIISLNFKPEPKTTPNNNSGTDCQDCNNDTKIIYRDVPVPYPVPYPVLRPYPILVPVGCCINVIPCIGRYCRTHHINCQHDCNHTYRAINPCPAQGCHKRANWERTSCRTAYECYNEEVNCNLCSEDYYRDYGSYQRCSGCFY